ncbi:hypothetical protein ACN27F_06325 [Solwaraspora sp. WMMB335]|uniref:hypothetical protein n=1 Tax=Solwaraspora sp. WMMB335 TaxID=3404118 RepID=UPI003B94ED6F
MKTMLVVPAATARASAPSGDDQAPTTFGLAVESGADRGVTVIPVSRGDTPLGVFVVADGGVRFRPVIATDRILRTALAVAALAALAATVATRRRPAAIQTVSMGPGGWLSLKGVPGRAPAVRSGGRRPWWAHLLRADRLRS